MVPGQVQNLILPVIKVKLTQIIQRSSLPSLVCIPPAVTDTKWRGRLLRTQSGEHRSQESVYLNFVPNLHQELLKNYTISSSLSIQRSICCVNLIHQIGRNYTLLLNLAEFKNDLVKKVELQTSAMTLFTR